jgi:hypothetical protein
MTTTRLFLPAALTCAFVLGSATASAQIADNCDSTLWNHVYNPPRLVQIHPCIRVTGTVILVRDEPDGDRHIQLKLDQKFIPLLDAENKSRQGSNLVLEPISVGSTTQADAIQPCQGLTNQVAIPKIGDHVAVTGSYVHDIEQGHGWMELHPVTLIEPN